MTDINIPPDTTETLRFSVQPSDLASVISPDESDQFPKVLATSRLVAFMEIACARLMVKHLPENMLSVGVRVDLTHSAPTPAGCEVAIVARFVEKKAKLFQFEVVATDEGGEIGKAKHDRAVVDGSRLEGGARKRTSKA